MKVLMLYVLTIYFFLKILINPISVKKKNSITKITNCTDIFSDLIFNFPLNFPDFNSNEIMTSTYEINFNNFLEHIKVKHEGDSQNSLLFKIKDPCLAGEKDNIIHNLNKVDQLKVMKMNTISINDIYYKTKAFQIMKKYDSINNQTFDLEIVFMLKSINDLKGLSYIRLSIFFRVDQDNNYSSKEISSNFFKNVIKKFLDNNNNEISEDLFTDSSILEFINENSNLVHENINIGTIVDSNLCDPLSSLEIIFSYDIFPINFDIYNDIMKIIDKQQANDVHKLSKMESIKQKIIQTQTYLYRNHPYYISQPIFENPFQKLMVEEEEDDIIPSVYHFHRNSLVDQVHRIDQINKTSIVCPKSAEYNNSIQNLTSSISNTTKNSTQIFATNYSQKEDYNATKKNMNITEPVKINLSNHSLNTNLTKYITNNSTNQNNTKNNLTNYNNTKQFSIGNYSDHKDLYFNNSKITNISELSQHLKKVKNITIQNITLSNKSDTFLFDTNRTKNNMTNDLKVKNGKNVTKIAINITSNTSSINKLNNSKSLSNSSKINLHPENHKNSTNNSLKNLTNEKDTIMKFNNNNSFHKNESEILNNTNKSEIINKSSNLTVNFFNNTNNFSISEKNSIYQTNQITAIKLKLNNQTIRNQNLTPTFKPEINQNHPKKNNFSKENMTIKNETNFVVPSNKNISYQPSIIKFNTSSEKVKINPQDSKNKNFGEIDVPNIFPVQQSNNHEELKPPNSNPAPLIDDHIANVPPSKPIEKIQIPKSKNIKEIGNFPAKINTIQRNYNHTIPKIFRNQKISYNNENGFSLEETLIIGDEEDESDEILESKEDDSNFYL